MAAPVLTLVLLALLAAAAAAQQPYDDEDDYDALFRVPTPPGSTPTTTTTEEPTTSTTTLESTTVTEETTTTPTTPAAPSSTTEGQDERELHGLLNAGTTAAAPTATGTEDDVEPETDQEEEEETEEDSDEGHEGTKRAGSTQAKGAATITKAMHSKPAAARTKDRNSSRNSYRQNPDGDDGTNSIWNAGYNPTTPIDPDKEDLHFVKVASPFEMVTPRTFQAPFEAPQGGHYRLTPELATKLHKLDFYFMQLAVLAEDCRRRLLCEIADQQLDFQPLSFVLMEESSFRGNYESVRPGLMSTTEGARLLSYMEATASGRDRARGCSGFVYRCATKAQDMVDMEALALWRDMVRWMSVQVVARRAPATGAT